MSPVTQLILLWILFGASHVFLSDRRVRPHLVERLGTRGFLGVYSLVSFAFFVPLVSVYMAHRHEGAWMWVVSMTPILTWTVYAVMTAGVLLAVAGSVSPSPTSATAGGVTPAVRGVHRLTRHPLFMGVGLIGLAHMVPNASVTDLAFFAGLPIFALIGCRHQELRLRASRGPDFAAYLDATPFLPFAGAGTLRGLREIPLWVWGVAVSASAALRWLHGPLFGP